MHLDNIIENNFIKSICQKIEFEKDGIDRYRVISPFHFNDGDGLLIVLKKDFDRWVLSDEKHTFRHITYGMNSDIIFEGSKWDVISDAITMFDVTNDNWELKLELSSDDLASAFYDFVQCILKIIDVSYLFRNRRESTFMEDFKVFMSSDELLPIVHLDWFDIRMDAKKIYKVDCKVQVDDRSPILIYAINTDLKLNHATISLNRFSTWNFEYRPLGIFEIDKDFNSNALSQFNDVCNIRFEGVYESSDGILNYIFG